MHVETRELVKSLDAIPAEKREGFVEVPKELGPAAEKILGNADSLTVNLSTKTERNKRKRARQKQREARKKNRK